MTFAKDQKVKVIGGAHKGKWGYVFREMNEFCMITIMDYKKAIARGDDEDLLVKREVRAKTKYLEVIPETIFEMPDESDLMPVYDLSTLPVAVAEQPLDPEGVEPREQPLDPQLNLGVVDESTLEEKYIPPKGRLVEDVISETLDRIIEDLKMPIPENDDDLLSNHSDDESVDIAADTRDPEDITDILPTVTEALQLRKDVKDLTRQNNELIINAKHYQEALDLFVKLCDFVRHRNTRGVQHSDSV